MENSQLSDFANKVNAGEIKLDDGDITTELAPATTTERLTNIIDDDDDAFVGIDKSKIGSTEVESIEDRIKKISMGNLKDANMDASLLDTTLNDIIKDTMKYRKSLMIENGFTTAEADAAAAKRAKRVSEEKKNEYITFNPETAVLKVDATKVNDVKSLFDDDTVAKIKSSKSIRLVEVDMKELPVLNLMDMPKSVHKMNAIRAKTCIAAKYELPLINTFDHAEFGGASSMALATAVMTDDEEASQYLVTKKQAEFLYEHFIGSTTVDKCDSQGNVLCSYEDFVNWLKFPDIDTCLYMVYVASSTEVINSEFFCKVDKCIDNERKKIEASGKPEAAKKLESVSFNYTYNSKELIKYENMNEKLKEDMDVLLSSKCRTFDGIVGERRERRATKMVYSEFTKNYYMLEIPSVATALKMLEAVETTDTTIGSESVKYYYIGFAMMIREIYMYGGVDDNGKDVHYVITNNQDPILPGENGEPGEPGGVVPLMKLVSTLPETELKILQASFSKMTYLPKFVIHTVCPHCGNVADTHFAINELVFLKATGTEAAIEV